MAESSEGLLAELGRGSEKAFSEVYHRYFNLLLSFSKRFVGSREDAEDLCAEVFTKLWQQRAQLGDIQNTEAFLFASVRRACLNFLRDRAVGTKRRAELEQELEATDGWQEQEEYRAADYRRLVREVEKLPGRCGLVMKLAYFEGMKNKEIAARLHIGMGTVKSQKIKGLRLLRLAALREGLSISVAATIYFHLLPG